MKRFLIFLVILIVILAGLSLGTKFWLEKNLEGMINANPNREYQISYRSARLHHFLKGITVQNVRIVPLDTMLSKTRILGSVQKADLNMLNWRALLFDRRIQIEEMIFFRPEFEITLYQQDTTRSEKTSRSIQKLFGDILSRGEIRRFNLRGGSILIKRDGGEVVGKIGEIQLSANQIETDSLQWKFPIPFKVGNFSAMTRNLKFHLNEDREMEFGSIFYSTQSQSMTIRDFSLHYNKPWQEISKKLGKQVDIIEMDLDELQINKIDAKSSLYGDLDIRSKSLTIRGLDLRDWRDKNFERPPDKEKPMFFGMVDSIPIGLKVDTIRIQDSKISYSEIPKGKMVPGTIFFDKFYGSIYNVTTLETYQNIYKQYEADIETRLNNFSKATARLTVPYSGESFFLEVLMDDTLEIKKLNEPLVAVAGIDAKSGKLNRLHLLMDAGKSLGHCRLEMDYSDLALEVFNQENHTKKSGMLSAFANTAIRNSNLAGSRNYYVPEFEVQRNIYRGPLNFIWLAVKEGLAVILPSETTKGVMKTVENWKKSRENKKKLKEQHKSKKKN